MDGIRSDSDVKACFSSDPNIDGRKKRVWMVDLAGVYKILYVNITSRVDCCGEWLNGYLKIDDFRKQQAKII